jgi:hypothetical protein
MFTPRTLIFYLAPPVILGTLLGAYKLWFAPSAEPEPGPPIVPPSRLEQPDGLLQPFVGGERAARTPAQTAGGQTQVPVPVPVPPPGEPVHDLDSAGRLLQELVGKLLGTFPEVAHWLRGPEAIRQAVAAVDCVSQGGSPRRPLAALAPTQPFQARQTADGWVIDAASYSRYDRIVGAFCVGEPAHLAEVYRRIEPALDLAYHQLGYGEGRFREVLRRAAAEVLAVPVPAEPVRVVPSGQTFAFADSALQAENDARKHLLRLGPANLRRVQARVRALAAAAALSVPKP